MTVSFQIEPSSGKPIYRQIMDQVVRLILSGHLKPGDELPSVRQVASELEVNPMTISKAYSLLEATGSLDRVRGKGMVVAANQKSTNSEGKKLKLLQPVLQEAARQARQLALPEEVVLQSLRRLLEDKNG